MYERPVKLLKTTRAVGGTIGIHAFAVDPSLRSGGDGLISLLYSGRRGHVEAVWANIMGGKNDVSFSWNGRWHNLKKAPGKGQYFKHDFRIDSGAWVRHIYYKLCTFEGCQSEIGNDRFYFFESDEETDALRFLRMAQENVLFSALDAWADVIWLQAKAYPYRLATRLESGGLKGAWRVLTDGERWRKMIEALVKDRRLHG